MLSVYYLPVRLQSSHTSEWKLAGVGSLQVFASQVVLCKAALSCLYSHQGVSSWDALSELAAHAISAIRLVPSFGDPDPTMSLQETEASQTRQMLAEDLRQVRQICLDCLSPIFPDCLLLLMSQCLSDSSPCQRLTICIFKTQENPSRTEGRPQDCQIQKQNSAG